MIPAKYRKIIETDDRYRRCFITGEKYSICIHHAMFGSQKKEELWNYIPLSTKIHQYGPTAVHDGNRIVINGITFRTRQICELGALLRAEEYQLLEFGLLFRKECLKSDKELYSLVLDLLRKSGFEHNLE
jgi:hypothetical protein